MAGKLVAPASTHAPMRWLLARSSLAWVSASEMSLPLSVIGVGTSASADYHPGATDVASELFMVNLLHAALCVGQLNKCQLQLL